MDTSGDNEILSSKSDDSNETDQNAKSSDKHECNSDKSDDEIMFSAKNRSKSRKNNIVDSDDESAPSEAPKEDLQSSDLNFSDDSSPHDSLSKKKSKKRIKRLNSDSDDSCTEKNTNKNVANNESDSDEQNKESKFSQSSRIKEKRNKMTDKFKNMLDKRKKTEEANIKEKTDSAAPDAQTSAPKITDLYDSESSDEEIESIKYENSHSENDEVMSNPVLKPKNEGKDGKPKVQRMSAKQAMKQMQKIKSESGRMLREKQVSLPYHKPKQITLKEIMAKKKINFTVGSKRLGFKMNEEELKQYAKQLEEREKEIIELCKSESESEEENDQEELNKDNVENLENSDETDNKNYNEVAAATILACKNLLSAFDDEENKDKKCDDTPSIENNEKTDQIIEDTQSTIGDDLEQPDENSVQDNFKNLGEETFKDKSDKPDEDSVKHDLNNSDEGDSPIISENRPKTLLNGAQVCDTNDNKQVFESELIFNDEDIENEGSLDDVEMLENTTRDKLDTSKENDINDAENLILELSSDDVSGIEYTKEDPVSINLLHEKPHPSTQINDYAMPSTSSQQMSCSAPILNTKPRLTGSPGCFIDLVSGEVKSGVELLKKKFMLHAAIKTAEELEREKDKQTHPGSLHMKLKRDLEEKMIDQRTQEWNKRLEEFELKKKEENDNLSECDELLEKEYKEELNHDDKEVDEDDSESEITEDEEEEDDIVIKDKPKTKCNLLDEEAEVDDDENADSEDDDEDEENDNDSSDDSGDEIEYKPSDGKKKLSRIIKPFGDSDSSDNEDNEMKDLNKIEDKPKDSETNVELDNFLSTPMKDDKSLNRTDTGDMFESLDSSKNNGNLSFDWDDLPLGQKPVPPGDTPLSEKTRSSISFNESKPEYGGRTDLASLVSPIIKLTAVQKRTSLGQDAGDENMSPNSSGTAPQFKGFEMDKLVNLQKKLLFECDASQSTQDTQELANLCSGKFPTPSNAASSSKPSNLDKLIMSEGASTHTEDFTQNTENELMELCTGKFVGINDQDSETMSTLPLNESQNISLFLSEKQDTETLDEALSKISPENQKEASTEKNIETIKATILHDEENHHSMNEAQTNDVTASKNKLKTKTKNKSIASFFQSANKKEIVDQETPTIKEVEPTVFVSNRGGKFVILSSEDEKPEDTVESAKKKVLKSKKERSKKLGKRKLQLQISDDEESEAEGNVSGKSSLIDEEDDRVVDYDSEENEIEVQPDAPQAKKPKKQAASEFFDQEAELTSEDEWRGSGDEDERGLDRLEWEEGDADQLDQRQVKKQLERIHLRTILDDDKREVRMLQEMLLEDDLEGGTRERKFRWKNVDSTIEVGTTVGDDDVENGLLEELQSEEHWRKQRHERETFLRQMTEKENSLELSQFSQESNSIIKVVSRTSLVKSTLISKTPLAKASTNSTTPTTGDKLTKEREVENESNNVMPNKKTTKDVPSPVKKPFLLMKNNARGSFLARGQTALNRLALLAKSGPQIQDNDTPSNLSSLAPGKRKNFVFAAVSPPCEEPMPEETKLAKRKATFDVSTPTLIKKIRVAEKDSFKSKKSLLDHME